MQALQDTYDDNGKLISGVLYDDDGNLISPDEPKIGDEVGAPEKLKEFDTQPFKANLDYFKPEVKPESEAEQYRKLKNPNLKDYEAEFNRQQKLWLKNHPIPGIGRNDERLTNVPELIEHGTQKLIDKSTMSESIPEWIKPGIARSLSLLGYGVEQVANILNDPTAPVMGVIGSLKKALANAALTQAAKDKLIADAAKEIVDIPVKPRLRLKPDGTFESLDPKLGPEPYPAQISNDRLVEPPAGQSTTGGVLPRLSEPRSGRTVEAPPGSVSPIVEGERNWPSNLARTQPSEISSTQDRIGQAVEDYKRENISGGLRKPGNPNKVVIPEIGFTEQDAEDLLSIRRNQAKVDQMPKGGNFSEKFLKTFPELRDQFSHVVGWNEGAISVELKNGRGVIVGREDITGVALPTGRDYNPAEGGKSYTQTVQNPTRFDRDGNFVGDAGMSPEAKARYDELNKKIAAAEEEGARRRGLTSERLRLPEAPTGSILPIVPEERLSVQGMFGQRAVEPNQGIISRFFEDDSSVAGSSGRPKRGYKIDVNTLNNPIAKIIVKLRQARPLTKEQAEIYRLERGRRVGNVENSAGFGQEWARNVKGALKGEYEKVRFDPLKLEGHEIDSLFEDIKNSDLNSFEKPRAVFAIEKIMRGVVPQKNEIRTLSSVFTKKLTRDLGDINAARDVTAQLVDSLYKKKPFIHRAAGGVQDLQRTIMSSMDMSAPFRQGGTGLLNKEWWTSWDDMFKAWGSESATKSIDDSIKAMPEFKLMQNSGLSLTDVTHGGVAEEGFGSAWAEKYIPFIKRSERAYGAFLNKFRSDLFVKMMKDAKGSGMSDDLAGQYIAEIINTMTGRASLGKAEKYVDALNQVFYAPRLMGSRVKMLEMLSPTYYAKQPAFVRKQALKSILSMATLAGTTNLIGKYIMGGSLEADPRSADFGKVKFGPTRIDPGTGELQYLTFLARTASQSIKTQSGDVRKFGKSSIYDDSTYDILVRFLENKAAPGVSLFLKGAKQYDPVGKEYNMPIEVAKTYVPMIMSDLADIFQSDPETYMPEMPKDPWALAAAPLTFFGMGSQTYK